MFSVDELQVGLEQRLPAARVQSVHTMWNGPIHTRILTVTMDIGDRTRTFAARIDYVTGDTLIEEIDPADDGTNDVLQQFVAAVAQAAECSIADYRAKTERILSGALL